MQRKRFFSQDRLRYFADVLANGVHDHVEWRPVNGGVELVHALDHLNYQLKKPKALTVQELHDFNLRFHELLHRTKEVGLLPVYQKELKRRNQQRPKNPRVKIVKDNRPIRPKLPFPHGSRSKRKIPLPRRH